MHAPEYISFPPSTLLNPTPVVLVSCAEKGRPENRNLITVAWAGTVNSTPPMLSISIRKERYSHDLILNSGEFVVNLVDEPMCKAVDFCGVRSGRDLDKAKACGLEYRPADQMDIAPAVNGAPVSLSCRVRLTKELGSHDLFLAEVVAIHVRRDLLDEQGTLHLENAGLIAYSHGLYQKLGGVLGFFGWSVARKEVFDRRMHSVRDHSHATAPANHPVPALMPEEISTEHLIQDQYIDFRKTAYRFPDGRVFEPYYSYSRRDYAVIVATDPEGRVLCVRQFRQGIRTVTTEFPAGGIDQRDLADPSMTAEDAALLAAKRELLEETGYISDQWTHLLTVPSQATISDNYAYLFRAENCRRAGNQRLDAMEFLNWTVLEPEDIDAMISHGDFQQAVHILAWELAGKLQR